MQRRIASYLALGLSTFCLRAFAPVQFVKGGYWPSEMLLAKYEPLVAWAPALGLVPLITAAVLLIRKKEKGLAASVLALGLFGFPASWLCFAFNNLDYWEVHERRQSPWGDIYSFLNSNGHFALTRRSGESLFWRHETVVGTDYDNSPRKSVQVIRPEGSTETEPLLFSDSGWVLGMGDGGRCYFAFHAPANRWVYLHELSPFVLLKADTAPNPADSARLIQIAEGNRRDQPTETALREALAHPNPHVRRIAKKLLDLRQERERLP